MIARGSHKISCDKKSRDKKCNVADSVRRDIKILATKTRYTVLFSYHNVQESMQSSVKFNHDGFCCVHCTASVCPAQICTVPFLKYIAIVPYSQHCLEDKRL